MSTQEFARHVEAASHDQGVISSLVIGATLTSLVLVITMTVAVAVAPVIDAVRAIV